jgi:competence protein ComEC
VDAHVWAVLPAAGLAVLVRRWWCTAAVLALVTGVFLGAVHLAGLHHADLVEGRRYDLTVRLSSAVRPQEGIGGPWWSATGSVVSGAAPARVRLSGSGEPPAAMGDELSAPMTVAAPRGRGETASLRVSGEPVVVRAGGVAAGVRAAMRQAAGTTDPGWLLSGMTLGQDEGLSGGARTAMQDSGLSHLTAVSGANCAILLVVVHWLCGWLRVPRWGRTAVAAAVLGGFVATVGPEPSVLRAAVMAGVTMAGALLGGRRAAGHVLQVSALFLLLIDPWLAYSVGFMLSIAATAGLILLVERGPLAATVAAQVATFPILVAIGGAVGLRTVIANVVVTPLAAVIPLVGLAAAGLQWLAGAGRAIAGAGRWLCTLVLAVARWDVVAPMSWLTGGLGVAVAAVVALTAVTVGRRHLVVVTIVLVGCISMAARLGDPWPPGDWWLVGCDVGQGDGFVVRSQGHVVVIDTGPDPQVMDGCLDRLGVDAVDLLVITHFHADHVGGLRGVITGRPVAAVWISPCHEPAEQYQAAAPALAALPVATPLPGTTVRVGDLWLQVVWPQRIIYAGSVPNNASLSLLLKGPQGSVAFLGDVEPEAQSAILRSFDIHADIVKVPHHGSAQFVPELPSGVGPQIALVGVGAGNTFGHPAPEAVSAWQQVGATVFTTEANGDIAVVSGRRVVVRGSD